MVNMLSVQKYILSEVINVRDRIKEFCNIDYCDILVEETQKILYPNRTFEEVPLIEEYDGDFDNGYIQYVIDEISKELLSNGVCFIRLANSSGEDKTFVHDFVLFNTTSGIIRLESYGKEIIYAEEGRKPGYILYKGHIVQWPTWSNDLMILLKLKSGEPRLYYWNGLFSAIEDVDTNELVDVILLK